MSDNERNAIVTNIVEVAPGLSIMRIEPDGWELPDFKSGQYAVLGLPGSAPRAGLSDLESEPPPDKLIKRAYSIASSSKKKEYVELFITMVRSGALTPRLFALKEGDRLFMAEKFKGVFTLDMVPVEMNLIMVATGTGLAPYMSMVRTTFMCDTHRHFAIIHGARHSWDLGYQAELYTMAGRCQNFAYLPTLSRPGEEDANWAGLTGYVQDVWSSGSIADVWGFAPSPTNSHIFLCGAPAMIQGMMETLTAEGFKEHKKKDPGQIHAEKYW